MQLKQTLGTAYGMGFERRCRMETDVLHEGKKKSLLFGSKQQQANTWTKDFQMKMLNCVIS